MKRREFLENVGWATVGAAGVIASATAGGCASAASHRGKAGAPPLEDRSVAELRAGLRAGRYSALGLTQEYLQRIAAIDPRDGDGPGLNSVIELNPDAREQARALDEEWRRQGPRSGWHGIPVLIKDNLATRDRMRTSAGSLALAESCAPFDSDVAARLRAAGAVLLGKTNLSEWANFRGNRSISGWSGRGGQTRNPYCTACNPSGSSSGSAAAVAAGLCAAAVGTETNGSIVSPSGYCGVVGIKPTVGLVSRSGIIPISASQDTAGPMARTVADGAALLTVMAGTDARDRATESNPGAGRGIDYEQHLRPGRLPGARLGVPRALFKLHAKVDPIFTDALERLRRAGADLVDLASLPSRQELGGADYQVMLYEFKAGLNAYLQSLGAGAPVRTLEEVIAFNVRHADRELKYFGQEILSEAQAKGPLTDEAYLVAKTKCRQWSDRFQSILAEQRLEAVVAPTSGPAHLIDYVHGDRGMGGSSTYAAVSGCPNITVPCGEVFGLPLGLSFFGPKWSEGRLIELAFGFEQAGPPRRKPAYAADMETLLAMKR